MSKAPPNIRSLARSYTEAAIQTLGGIMGQTAAPPSARVAAAVALMDRGWGKPAQIADVTVRRAIAKEIADDELAAIATGSSDGAAEAQDDSEESD